MMMDPLMSQILDPKQLYDPSIDFLEGRYKYL